MAEYKIIESTHPILAPLIDHYMHVSGVRSAPSKKILPRPGVSLIFDFSAPFYCGENRFFKALSGLHNHSFNYESGGEPTDHLVVQFSPHGLSRFIKIPMEELTDQIIEPGIIFGEDINDLYAQIGSTASLYERIELIEAFLLERYTPPLHSDAVIFTIADTLRRDLSHLNLKKIKNQSSLSLRQVERKFKSIVGTNLQTYIRICRIDYAKSLLIKNPSLRLTDIGLEAGYYDQSHFSNDFKRVSGVPPGQFNLCLPP